MNQSCSGHQQLVRFLIQKGAHVNHVNKNGWSALCFAAAYGKLEHSHDKFRMK